MAADLEAGVVALVVSAVGVVAALVVLAGAGAAAAAPAVVGNYIFVYALPL